jgi:YidC/Oxa1 family membrane protein insertase
MAALLGVLAWVAFFGGAGGALGQSPDASAGASPAPASTPAATPDPASPTPAASLPGGANPAVAQPPCPYVPPTLPPVPTPDPAATPNPSATPVPAPTLPPAPLCPAQLSGNPADLLAFLFNPIFQTLFLALVLFYNFVGDIGIAIILLTIGIKTLLIPISRAQIVSQRRMQLIQPEVRAIQQKYKGNRAKVSEETMRLYRERGISPASGCLPALLQLFLLIPIYSVIQQGLAAPDIQSALQFLTIPVLQDFQCQLPGELQPCIDPTIAWLGDLDAHVPEILFNLPVIGFGVSGLALVAATLQLVQTRMAATKTNDPQQAAQQRIFLLLPLFSIIYGAILPAGLFIYWIVFTLYSIVQQYLVTGWGALFPLFGWTPRFAVDHQPRFPVSMPSPPPPSADGGASRRSETDSRTATDRAAGTIKPARQRARTSRRGRRR